MHERIHKLETGLCGIGRCLKYSHVRVAEVLYDSATTCGDNRGHALLMLGDDISNRLAIGTTHRRRVVREVCKDYCKRACWHCPSDRP